LGSKLLTAAHNPSNAFLRRQATEAMNEAAEARKIPYGSPGTSRKVWQIPDALQAEREKQRR
jgi:hypothetical protein